MDPITKALERARQDGQSVRQWVHPESGVQTPEALEPKTTDHNTTDHKTTDSETTDQEMLQLDKSVLHQNRLLSGTDQEDPVITDLYRLLRTRILQIMRANGWHSIGITSPSVKAGKTVTSINLASSIAREGNYEVTLIDADIRKPSAAQYMGIEHPFGLPDFLDNRASLSDVVMKISDPVSLSFISGVSQSNERPTPDILKRNRMKELVNVLTRGSKSQFVVVDLPPVLIGDDVIAVAANLDCLLMIVDETSTNIDDLRHSAELLSQVNLVGTVMNKSIEKTESKADYYHYHRSSDVDEQPNMSSAEDS